MKVLKGIWDIIVSILSLLAMPFLGIFYLFYMPFEAAKYHKTQYYRDIGRKYSPAITDDPVVKIYDYAKKNGLPLELFSNGNYEYFVAGDTVLHCGWEYSKIEEIYGSWYFIFENAKVSMDDKARDVLMQVREEHRDMYVKFAYLWDSYKEESAKELQKCYYFYSVK